MPGVGMQELCCLFCCPPLPSRIAAKLAFLPPEPTYSLVEPLPSNAEEINDRVGAGSAGSCCTTMSKSTPSTGNSDDHDQLIPPPPRPGPPKQALLTIDLVANGGTGKIVNKDSEKTIPPTPSDMGSTTVSEQNSINRSCGSKAKVLTKLLKGVRAIPNNASSGSSLNNTEFPSYGIHLSARAEWQYGAKELDRLELITAKTSRGSVIPCLMVRCGPPMAPTLIPPPADYNVEPLAPKNSADPPTTPDPFGHAQQATLHEMNLDGKKRTSPLPNTAKGSFVKKNQQGNHHSLNSTMIAPGVLQKTTFAPTKYTLLFSHGNAVDLGQMSSFYLGLGTRLGCDVFGYDYTGYGASVPYRKNGSGPGKNNGRRLRPSEADLYTDAEAAWRALQTKFHLAPNRIVLYGQSIGTVPTIHLAALFDGDSAPAGVVLHSPLTSGLRVAFPFVVPGPSHSTLPSGTTARPGRQTRPDRQTKSETVVTGTATGDRDYDTPRGVLGCLDAFATMDKVRLIIRSPTLVIHGTDDEVIDHSHGRAIHANLPRPVDPLWVRGAGHNDIELHSEFLTRLKKFIREELRHDD